MKPVADPLDVWQTSWDTVHCCAGSDNAFALGCADGTFRLISEMGREEKKVGCGSNVALVVAQCINC